MHCNAWQKVYPANKTGQTSNHFRVKRIVIYLFISMVVDLSAIADTSVFLTTDREYYLAGEMVLVDLFMIDRNAQLIEAGQVSLAIDLVDEDGAIVEKIRKIAYQGMTKCIFELPENLKTGYYRIYAYSEEDEGKSLEHLLQKKIKIIDPDTEIDSLAEQGPQLFPEGGQLVAGIENQALLFLPDQLLSSKSLLLLDQEDTIQSLKPQNDSFLGVNILPRDSSEFFLIVDSADRYAISTTSIKNSGILLQAKPVVNGFLCNVNTVGAIANRKFNLRLDQKDTTIELGIINLPYSFTLEKHLLTNGLNYLLVQDDEGSIVTGRALYQTVSIAELTPNLDLPSIAGTRELAKGSFAIEPSGAVTTYLTTNIWEKQYRYNNRELLINAIQSGHLSNDVAAKISEDQLRQIAFTLPVSISRGKISFEPLLELIGKTAPQNTVSFSCPECRPIFQVATSDQNGYFRFDFSDFNGTRPGYFHNWTNDTNEAEFENRKEVKYTAIPKRPISLLPKELAYLRNFLELKTIKSSFQSIYQNQLIFESPDEVSLSVDYDDLYVLSEYVQFPEMEDVMREIVLGTIVRENKNGYKVRILNRQTKYYYKEAPLILLDGIPIDTRDLMQLNPNDLEAIAVSRPPNNYYYFGNLGSNGVIMVLSRNKEAYSEYISEMRALQVFGTSTDKQLKFAAHDQKSSSAHRPDFRSLLFHQVYKRTTGTNQVEFYTSDKATEYMFTLQGFTSEGKFIHLEKSISISPEN